LQAGATTTSKAPTTSLAASTSTTTSVAATTSSTTLPDESCPAIPGQSPFQRIECRLEALEHTTGTIAGLGTLRPKLGRGIGKALDRVTGAHDSCSFGKTKAARRRLNRAIKNLARYGARLRSRAARQTIAENLRETLAAEVNQILSDVRVLRGTVGCPGDA
jgi:hypothetical protein